MEHFYIWLALYMVIGYVIAANDQVVVDEDAITDERGWSRVGTLIMASIFMIIICFCAPLIFIWRMLFYKTKP